VHAVSGRNPDDELEAWWRELEDDGGARAVPSSQSERATARLHAGGAWYGQSGGIMDEYEDALADLELLARRLRSAALAVANEVAAALRAKAPPSVLHPLEAKARDAVAARDAVEAKLAEIPEARAGVVATDARVALAAVREVLTDRTIARPWVLRPFVQPDGGILVGLASPTWSFVYHVAPDTSVRPATPEESARAIAYFQTPI
jgi:hypothetical protein